MKIDHELAYLDYVNNFLTVEAFAQCYKITVKEANALIHRQRQIGQAHLTRYRAFRVKFRGPTENGNGASVLIRDEFNSTSIKIPLTYDSHDFSECAYLYLTEKLKIEIQARCYIETGNLYVYLSEDFSTPLK